MIFSIKQYSELPILKMKLLNDGRSDYKNVADYLENSIITFAMRDEKSGIYQIANKSAQIELQNPCNEDYDKEYYIAYNFTSDDTCKPGLYVGEFNITYLDPTLQTTSKLIVPIQDTLYIKIIGSFIKSDVTYIT